MKHGIDISKLNKNPHTVKDGSFLDVLCFCLNSILPLELLSVFLGDVPRASIATAISSPLIYVLYILRLPSQILAFFSVSLTSVLTRCGRAMSIIGYTLFTLSMTIRLCFCASMLWPTCSTKSINILRFSTTAAAWCTYNFCFTRED